MTDAARKAGKGLSRDFGELEHLQVSRKGQADFVTSADTKAEGLKAGLDAPQTVAKAVACNWAGFRAAWLQRDAGKAPANGSDVFDGVH